MNATAAGATADTPTITEMQVIPVAGHDSMLLNLAGAHGPFFTRIIVILKDTADRTGIAEVPGSEAIRQTLERIRPLVIGTPARPATTPRSTACAARSAAGQAAHQSTVHQVTSEAEAAILRQPHEINLRIDNVITGSRGRRCSICSASSLAFRSRRCSATASSASGPHAGLSVLHRRPHAAPTCRITPTRRRKTAGCACATNRH